MTRAAVVALLLVAGCGGVPFEAGSPPDDAGPPSPAQDGAQDAGQDAPGDTGQAPEAVAPEAASDGEAGAAVDAEPDAPVCTACPDVAWCSHGNGNPGVCIPCEDVAQPCTSAMGAAGWHTYTCGAAPTTSQCDYTLTEGVYCCPYPLASP